MLLSIKAIRQASLQIDIGANPPSKYYTQYLPEEDFPLSVQQKILQALIGEDFPLPNAALLQNVQDGVTRLPKGAEKWCMIPHWSLFGPTYIGAVTKVLELLAVQCKFPFRVEILEYLRRGHYREYSTKTRFWAEIMENQGSKTVILPFQFGALHAGRCMHEALIVSMFLPEQDNVVQVCFGLYEACILLLTHPTRLSGEKDLWIDAPGDEISVDFPDMYRYSPAISVRGNVLTVEYSDVDIGLPEFGTISGFLMNS